MRNVTALIILGGSAIVSACDGQAVPVKQTDPFILNCEGLTQNTTVAGEAIVREAPEKYAVSLRVNEKKNVIEIWRDQKQGFVPLCATGKCMTIHDTAILISDNSPKTQFFFTKEPPKPGDTGSIYANLNRTTGEAKLTGIDVRDNGKFTYSMEFKGACLKGEIPNSSVKKF